jgi:signal peptidase I
MPRLRVLIRICALLGLLALASALTVAVKSVSSYSIPAGSMIPAVVPGEMIFASRHYYRSHAPVPGDIVLFHVPRDGALTTFIKRVVAGPGDRVRMEQGRLVINGVMAERSVLPPLEPVADFTANTQHYRETLPNGRSYEIVEMSDDTALDAIPEILVEPGRYFVMGDYRDRSNDSRNPTFGTIGLDAIDDKASIIWMSRDWHRIGKALQPVP